MSPVGELRLYNTRTRRKEVFEPLEHGHARVYTCGPTVYSPQHIGNMRPNLFADLLKRALLAQGLRVTHVINVTDVGHLTDDVESGDDKLELAAQKTGRRAQDIARQYTEQWLGDRRRLNCLEPEVVCKATEHIPEQIAMVQMLEDRGYTYRIADGIYFDTSKFSRYAEFAGLDLGAQLEGARIGDVEGKRNPADFSLWKFAPPGVVRQQEWDSPWGRGFPGWHLECSAMSIKYLGSRFDIHTGGVEHVNVHHTNEIAQSECALDVHPWVQLWMHEDWIVFQGEKISKSKGTVYLLQDIVDQGFLPLSFRYFFLQAHYRKQQNFHDEAMAAADRGYRRLLAQVAELRSAEGEVDPGRIAEPRQRFYGAVADDLNAPRALAVAQEVVRRDDLTPAERRALLEEFDGWLGLELLSADRLEREQESDPRIEALLEKRQTAREARDFAEADRIRDLLAGEGVVIEDTSEGPRWKRT
jgi:cysteinyl-tRNA synthetase